MTRQPTSSLPRSKLAPRRPTNPYTAGLAAKLRNAYTTGDVVKVHTTDESIHNTVRNIVSHVAQLTNTAGHTRIDRKEGCIYAWLEASDPSPSGENPW